MHRFDLNAIAPSPWKNGGGSTREIVCWPLGANLDNFAWRISVAHIAQAGAFSTFAGIDRQILLLAGDGLRLHSQTASLDLRLDQLWQPVAFSGDLALDCELLGGVSTDCNVMVRRGAWQAQVHILQHASLVGRTPAGLCLVLQGQWQVAGALLQPGEGLWWDAAPTRQLQTAPSAETAFEARAALLHISLWPSKDFVAPFV